MKNKHLVLLAFFGAFGVYFFQKWPFTNEAQVHIPFLTFQTSTLEMVQYNGTSKNSSFELRRTPKWVLTTQGINLAVQDSAVYQFLAPYTSFQSGTWSNLPKGSEKIGQWEFIFQGTKTLQRAVYRSPDSLYYVKILDKKTDAYLFYENASYFDKITKQNPNDLRNRTILPINPTDIRRFSFSSDSLDPIFYEKKDSIWSGIGSSIGEISLEDMNFHLANLEKLNHLPFADLFDPNTSTIERKLSFNFETLKGGLQLHAMQTKKHQWFVRSSALQNQWFELPEQSRQYLFFTFGF